MKKLSPTQIVHLVHAFAPKMTGDGVCNGFSSMLAQAVITGEKEKKEFFNRLDLISKYFEDPRNNPATLKQEVDAIFKTHTPDPITKEVPPFTEDELLKIGVRAFAEAIAIQQDPSSLRIFHSIDQNDKDKLYPLTVSKALEKRLEETESVKLKADLVGILGLDLSGLVYYLEKMKGALERQQSPQDFAFILNSDDHSIHLNFDSETNKWQLTDINHLSGKINYYFEVNSDELAPIIFNSFSDNSRAYTVISTVCVSLGNNPKAIQLFTNISNQLMPTSINRVNSRGYTCLDFAVEFGHLEVVKFLLDNGADITVPNIFGNTALHEAATYGQLEAVKILIENSSAINIPNNDGDTPFHRAASNGHLEVINFLLKNEADIKAQNKKGNTALHFAATQGHLEVVEFLLKNGADIMVLNLNGNTPLHFAAFQGRLEVVKFLLDNGVDITVLNLNGNTPLHFAAFKGHVEVVKYLSEKMATPSAPTTETVIFSSMQTTDHLNLHKRDKPEDNKENISSEKKIKKQRK